MRRSTTTLEQLASGLWSVWLVLMITSSSSVSCGSATVEAAGVEQLQVNAPGFFLAPPAEPPHMLKLPVLNLQYDPNRWAQGGAAVWSKRQAKEEPFGSSDGTLCALTRSVGAPLCPLMAGAATPPVRQDISEGQPGLPMRLMLRVLGPNCEPIDDAWVSVWHASPTGAYSGPTAYRRTCAPRQPEAALGLAFRGIQPTDVLGTVTFDSCFPGRVHGRTVVINVAIRRGTEVKLNTQLLFDDALVADIESHQSPYAQGAVPTIHNDQDPFMPRDHLAAMTLNVVQMADGAMLAYKNIVIDSAWAAFGTTVPPPAMPAPKQEDHGAEAQAPDDEASGTLR